MAKISARGDRPRQAWELVDGGRVVYTVQGRLLRRYGGTQHYNLVQARISAQEAIKYAELAQAIAKVGR